jgi:PAS domain S-box-containing protein
MDLWRDGRVVNNLAQEQGIPDSQQNIDNIRAALEKNCRLLKQQNSALMLRNAMLSQVSEIACGIDSLRTENDVFNLVVESSRDIAGISFVLVLKLNAAQDALAVTYNSHIRQPGIAMGLKMLGFEIDHNLAVSPSCLKLQFPLSKIPGGENFIHNPGVYTIDRISQSLEEVWGRRLCDAVQGLLQIKQFVIVPLTIDTCLWGALLFFLKAEIPADILEKIGKHCSIALKNVHTLEMLEKRQSELTALNQVSCSISGSLETEKILEQTIVVLRKVFNAAGVAVYLLEDEGKYLYLAGQYGMTDEVKRQSSRYSLHHPFARFLESPEPYFSSSLPSALELHPGVSSLSDGVQRWFINAALVFGDKRAGIITIIRTGKNDFEAEEKALLISISNQLSVALDNSFLHQKLVSRISELEATENRLTLSEEKMRLTLESISDGVMLTSLDGRILEANNVAVKLHGYDQDMAFLGKSSLRFVVFEDRRRMLEQLHNVVHGGVSRQAAYHLIKKDGSTFQAECSIGTFKNLAGEIQGFVISIRDISERALVQQRLQESARKYSLIAENTNDFIAMLTISGYYTYASPSYLQLGYDTAELLDMNVLDLVHLDDRENIVPVLLRFSQMDQGDIARLKRINYSQRLEYRLKDKEGKWHDILATGNIIESLDGKGFNLLIIGHDISDLKLAETQLKQSYSNEKSVRQALEHEINKRADFFRALVHELKTPLTPIMVSSETISELVENETFKNLARNVYQSAVKLNSRVDELLDISKAEMGMLKVDLEPIDMMLVIKNVVAYLRKQTERNHQSLVLNLPPELPLVMGDESRLRQVMLNLLSNAIKFTPDGGMISVSALNEDELLKVFVQDTGKGIEDADRERLFQPYNRIEADRQNFSGLGLGLALAKQLIELHGGRIWVNSLKGRGTTFGFSLPVVKGYAPEAKTTDSQLRDTASRQ